MLVTKFLNGVRIDRRLFKNTTMPMSSGNYENKKIMVFCMILPPKCRTNFRMVRFRCRQHIGLFIYLNSRLLLSVKFLLDFNSTEAQEEAR